jgi:glycosyltransferase involved in cell wall biosynthesis
MPEKSSNKILFYNVIPMPHSILLHKVLIENGYEVYFWYFRDLTSLYPWSSLDAKYKYTVYGKDGNGFIKLIRDLYNSDLVIITGWHTKIHVLIAGICFIFRKKYAYWIDVPPDPKPGVKRFIKKKLLKMSDYLLITGREGIRRVSSWSGIKDDKFWDFPYLGAPVRHEEYPEINKNRNKCVEEGGSIKVLICNRFEKRKGYHNVLKALRDLEEKEFNKFIFTLIGSGTEFEYYKSLFQKMNAQIYFKYWVEYEDYLNYIRETDILIHPSLQEPFGIPPIDAMAHGKLVIVSDAVMSTRDRVINGINGFMFKADKPLELSEILKTVVKNPELIYQLGSQAAIDSELYQPEFNVSVINEIINN